MDNDYSVEAIQDLVDIFHNTALHRPMRMERYEPGTEWVFNVTGVADGKMGSVRLGIDRFVGGGFAGQVYQVKILHIQPEHKEIGGLEEGKPYAMKILIPPTGFSRFFRNALYWVGFQGPFQLQINPAAARSGAIWQKFIRRGAKIRFGDEAAVADIYATFMDSNLGSYGELSEWIDGRTWRLEVDDRQDLLRKWKRGKTVDREKVGSPEYRAKYEFMHQFVKLLHHMGGHEFARQYEWSTCKSQPNCLKRHETDESPTTGLVAVDFRAGLTLLPFLPMSPGDVKLIGKGLLRGSLVQFDRGNVKTLERFIAKHEDAFADMHHLIDELKENEGIYRNSVPDLTHNHIRFLYSGRLWSTMLSSAITGWTVRNLIDDTVEKRLRMNRALTLIFFIIGMIPLLGGFLTKIWGRADWRRHYKNLFMNRDYLYRAIRGRIAEKVMGWHRSGRVTDKRARRIANESWRFLGHLPFSILPARLHKVFTDWEYAKERLAYYLVRPVRLYFNSAEREQWLLEMVAEGEDNHLLDREDAEVIRSQIKEPFIQKYLKSLAVHVCTLPVTQIVSVSMAILYVIMHPEMPRAYAWGIGLGIIAIFQVTPISPGSLVRGFYVLFLVIKERNFKDYNIAVFLGFFKYIGYLAFPIQMAYRYPALGRFMAGYWATEAVHIVPVFGERGALLEHGVFNLFYNWPLTLRRRMVIRGRIRAALKPRYWHIPLLSLAGAAVFGVADLFYIEKTGTFPSLTDLWWLTIIAPLICGSAVTLGAGGATVMKRIVGGGICGVMLGGLTLVMPMVLSRDIILMNDIVMNGMWRAFVFGIVAAMGVLVTEIRLPEPKKMLS
jgi:hypothetical protein